jgi:hypothetical protein
VQHKAHQRHFIKMIDASPWKNILHEKLASNQFLIAL